MRYDQSENHGCPENDTPGPADRPGYIAMPLFRVVKKERDRMAAEVERQERLRRKATQKTRMKHNEIKRLRKDLQMAFEERDELRAEVETTFWQRFTIEQCVEKGE